MQNESDLKLKKQKEFLIKFCYFGVIIGTTIIIIKVLGSILTPFLIAFIIAAILNPLTAPLYPYYLSLHFIQLHLL